MQITFCIPLFLLVGALKSAHNILQDTEDAGSLVYKS
jgi:hypothetical protein